MLDQLVGQTVDQFKIVSTLGGGGMGKVFQARDLSLQRDVAIKVMHPHIAEQPNFRERFLQDARTAARLDHPGIVQVYHFGKSQGLLYIVMKYIQGIDLDKLLTFPTVAGATYGVDHPDAPWEAQPITIIAQTHH